MNISDRWIKEKHEGNEFSSYQDILLNESDLKHIKTMPSHVFNKLLDITKAELWKKCLEGKITANEAQWAILFAKYMKTYFNK